MRPAGRLAGDARLQRPLLERPLGIALGVGAVVVVAAGVAAGDDALARPVSGAPEPPDGAST